MCVWVCFDECIPLGSCGCRPECAQERQLPVTDSPLTRQRPALSTFRLWCKGPVLKDKHAPANIKILWAVGSCGCWVTSGAGIAEIITLNMHKAGRCIICKSSSSATRVKQKLVHSWSACDSELCDSSSTFHVFFPPLKCAVLPSSCQRKWRQSGVDLPSGVAGVLSVGQATWKTSNSDKIRKKIPYRLIQH